MSDAPDFSLPTNPSQQRDNVIPRFYMKAVQNNFKTAQEGRAVFDDLEFVEIRVPGDRNTVVDRPVLPEHKGRWPQYYRAFQDQKEAPSEGTPLTEWPRITRGQAEELAYFHVKTVEQLAALSDEQLAKCWPMGGRPIREAAQRALLDAAGAAPMEKLAAENASQKETIEAMGKQMADLAKRLDEMQAQRASAGGA